MNFELTGHLVEIHPKLGDFIVPLFFDHLRVQLTLANALRSSGQTSNWTRQAFCKPQSQKNRSHNKKHSKGEVQNGEIEQNASTLRFALLIKQRCFLCIIQKGEQFTINVARHIEVIVAKPVQIDQGAHFIVDPILDQHHIRQRGVDFSGARIFEIKEVRSISAKQYRTRSINDEGFAQPTLNLKLTCA